MNVTMVDLVCTLEFITGRCMCVHHLSVTRDWMLSSSEESLGIPREEISASVLHYYTKRDI